jgi:hypothetical protein
MIFLSKKGQDEYINMFAYGCGQQPVNSDDFEFDSHDQEPIVLRGILNRNIKRCIKKDRKFYYMDSGYVGNHPGPMNPQGWKLWHRIVSNDLQHNEIVTRPSDRWERLKLKFESRRYGSKIIVAAPDEKPCKFYGVDQQAWIEETVSTIKQHTDRPVVVRQRAASRQHRVFQDPLSQVLREDCHALVTFNSVAAIESILTGVPAFVLAPSHAAGPVASRSLSQIETPYWPDLDKLHAWAHHLAYGQFHISELKDGLAQQILIKQ